VPGFRAWIRRFPVRYAVDAGEGLKELRNLPQHIEKILEKTQDISPGRLTIVAMGGGSVGDFSAFVASILKRGVGLVHIPTTWLAAIDSSHGGKTALNVAGAKNQVGTFYPASRIVIIKNVLDTLPSSRSQEALAELGKMALIDGGSWVKTLMRERNHKTNPSTILWKYAKYAIQAKYRVVEKDPYEKRGYRQILNFGHTLGHVIEAARGVSHGTAVAQGLFFALDWSFDLGLCTRDSYLKSRTFLTETLGIEDKNTSLLRVSRVEARDLLKRDKKVLADGRLHFIYLRRPGRVERIEVTLKNLLVEGRRQGRIQ
jgi:3-dehydroquinate synthase